MRRFVTKSWCCGAKCAAGSISRTSIPSLSFSRRPWCIGIGPGFAAIGDGNHDRGEGGPQIDAELRALTRQISIEKASPRFSSWLLSKTKFGKHASSVRLLHLEQSDIRPRKFWWKHWWCEFPGQTKKGGEIDIFMVFELSDTKRRFSLHIENKRHSGAFEDGQPEGYRLRAQHMANRNEYLRYEEFETTLISPLAFRDKYRSASELFGSYISYEEIAEFVPEFGISHQVTRSTE